VKAWSGPNEEKNYPTIELSQSAPVTVKCDKYSRPIILQDVNPQHPGWVEIKPPQGSFSWIHQRFLRNLNDKTWVVNSTGPVGIYVGSGCVNDEPRVEKTQLPNNTQVIVLSPPAPSKLGGYYYPIQSPDTEPRYLPANAINLTKVSPASPAASPAGGVSQVSGKVPANGPAAAGSYATLFAQADAAERLGDTAKAKSLFEAARKATTNPQEQVLCSNRIDYLQRNATAGAWSAPGGGPNRPVTGTTALYAANQASSRALVPGQRQWTEWGILKKTNLPPVDGQEVFRLEVNGQPFAYATAQPGFTLSNYVGRYLTLYGLVSMSPDDSMRLMRVSVQHVSLK
jgi:hypothetical protein